MRVTSDSEVMPAAEGAAAARRLVEDDSLGATQMSLDIGGRVLRFEGLRSGNAMLYREDPGAENPFIALDAYDRERVVALIDLFAENPESMIASIEWQEDYETGLVGYIIMVIAGAVVVALFYGLFVEFFG